MGMNCKRLIVALCLTLGMGRTIASAQTDMTSRMVNPSFEQNLDGWENNGMQAQSNSAFKLKVGSKYCEKWTGRNGKVGDASIQQVMKGLPAGTYTVSVVAQNIQEDTPETVQTGVYLKANEAETEINVAAAYSVSTTICDGELTAAFIINGATGNYVTVDNFQLMQEKPTTDTYTVIHSQLQALLDEADKVNLKTLDTSEQRELDAAIAAVKALLTQDTTEGVMEAACRLKEATYDYRLSIANDSESINMTSLITNPSFEKGLDGWENDGMYSQGNDAFKLKAGSKYCEKWTGRGGKVSDATISQCVTMPNGKYVLTAAAQNIQEDTPNMELTGAYLFADDYEVNVGTRKVYSLTFYAIEGQANIGFKLRKAQGNWDCVDNFTLTYHGRSDAMLLQALQTRIGKAEKLGEKHMKVSVLDALNAAIAQARTFTTADGMEQTAVALRECMEEAQASIETYALLKTAIDEIEPCYDGGKEGAEEFHAAIEKAKSCYEDRKSTNDEVKAEEEALHKAMFLFRIRNATGPVPAVTTNRFVARGATGALGRSTVSGSNILEKGFCWSTEHNPTVLDNRSSKYYDNNGPLYLMQPLEPATVYYVRAYAITEDYAVGYGEERKVITLPMGNSTYWYNWGGSPEENERIDNALKECIYYYNNWSCTTNFGISCSYSAGTPTADCSYGGYMRVGANSSYQRTGTILHESNHGVGVGQQARWWDTNLHDGVWKGYRANSLVQFLDNNPNATMAGDGMHMWPYGINGAHEDTGNPFLYIGNVMITQALHEDGLIPPGHGGCKPAYVFEHDDDVKYYITNEDNAMGSGVSYLTESETGVLTWSTAMAGVTNDDAFAWYMTYDPQRQLYTIRNAKSGKYFSYSSGIKTVTKSVPSDTEHFHLMVGRNEMTLGGDKYGLTTRGYWIMAGTDVENPASLTAAANGRTSVSNFDISDGASKQRWLILTAKEVEKASIGSVLAYKSMLGELIRNLRVVESVPYVEVIEGADSHTTFSNLLNDMEGRLEIEENADNLAKMYEETLQGGMDYIGAVAAADEGKPFDLTFLMVNPSLKEDAEGWEGDKPTHNNNCVEFFQRSFNMNQTVAGLPKGKYVLTVQGFQRPGAYNTIYSAYESGEAVIDSKLYMGPRAVDLRHICDDGQAKKMGIGAEVSVGSPALYIPDNTQAADKYFSEGLYQTELIYNATNTRPRTIKLGVRGMTNETGYWTCFRNFHLYFYGPAVPTTSIEEVEDAKATLAEGDVYDLQGRKAIRVQKGLFIQNGKLIIVK